ncbi:MAG TPA: HtaA domain-containing protein [Solirubrobacterales bacterium]
MPDSIDARRGLLQAALALTAIVLAWLAWADVPSARAADAPAAPAQITEGSLNWGVKASFRRYIGEAGITTSGGVARSDDATSEFPVPGFDWPLVSGSFDSETSSTVLQFGGSVHFLAHEGLLDMTVSEPKLVLTGGESTLYAAVKSRPFSSNEVIDYGVIPVVSLDLSEAEPTVADGSTSWTALPSFLTTDAGPAFAGFYSVSTDMDPVSATYEGPGGKAPTTVEAWDSPGSAKYEKVLVAGGVHATSVWPDLAHDAIVVVEQGGAIRALDPGTLQPLGSPAPISRQENITISHSAYDPVHGALFVVVGAVVHELTWDAAGSSFSDATLPGASLANDSYAGLAYNSTAGELAVYNGKTMVTWIRDGVSWEHAEYDLESEISAYMPRIAVDDDGDVLTATAAGAPKEVLTYEFEGEHFAYTETLPGDYTDPQAVQPGQYDQPSQVVIGPDGTAYFGSYLGRVWAAEKGEDGLYHQVGSAVSQGIGNVFDSAVDPTDGTVLLAAQGANRVLAYRDGATAGSTSIPSLGFPNNFPYPYMGIAVDTDHYLYVNSSDTAEGGLWKLRRVGLTPTITTQPQDATKTLVLGEASGTVTFTAAAEGTPAPTLRWQSRAGSSDRWTDLPGETGTTLRLTATVQQSGLQVRAVATNAAGTLASEPATLDVEAPPAIVVQPESQATVAGTPVSFGVASTGNPAPGIQWQRLDPSGFWVNVEDATSATLTIDEPTTAMSGATLRARLRNAYGTVYTRSVTLIVAPSAAGPVGVTGGYLDWGVKASFRDYIRGPIAQGDYTTAGGASENADGTLRFPVLGGSYDPATRVTSVRLGGSVQFTGHAGALDLTFSALHVALDGAGEGTLYADAVTKADEPDAQPVAYAGVALADLDETVASVSRTGGSVSWSGIGAKLSAAGAPAFAGFYSVGHELDPASLAITVGGPVNDGPGAGESGGPGESGSTGAGGGDSSGPVAAPSTEVEAVSKPKAARWPKVRAVTGSIKVRGRNAVRIATITCAEGPCKVRAPKVVAARIGGKRSLIEVLAPRVVRSGGAAPIRLRLTAAEAKALKGHAVRLSVRVVSIQGTRRTELTVHPKLRAVSPRRSGGAGALGRRR